MKSQTFYQFKKEKFGNELNRGIYEWLTNHHKKAVYFITQLRKHGIPFYCIDINDWNCNTNPSVYVNGRQYSRLAKNDYKLALEWYHWHGHKITKK